MKGSPNTAELRPRPCQLLHSSNQPRDCRFWRWAWRLSPSASHRAERMVKQFIRPVAHSMVQPGVTTGPPVDIPQTNLTPIAPPTTTYAPPPNGYGSFDPYSSTPASGAGGIPGVTSSLGPGVTTIGPPAGGYPTTPSSNGSLFGLFSSPTAAPMAPAGYGTQTMAPINNPPIYGPSPYDVPPTGTVYGQPGGFPNSAYPQSTPSSLFPEGFGPIYSGSVLQTPIQSYSAFRLLQGPRFRYTYVTPSSEPDNLGINDFDFSLAFAFPNFLHCTQPLFVIPSFSLHLWDGPNNPVADLPPNAYSAFVDMGWESDPNKLVGTELGLRMGVFTDFNTYNSNSFMIRGSAAGDVSSHADLDLQDGDLLPEPERGQAGASLRLLLSPQSFHTTRSVLSQPPIRTLLPHTGNQRPVVVCDRRIWRRQLDDRTRCRLQRSGGHQ